MIFNFNSLREANVMLDALREMDAACNQNIDRLLIDFQTTHADPPARITRMRGRVLAWRRKARTPSEQTTLTLTGDVGQRFLTSLPPLVRKSFCEFELRRLDVCAKKRLVSYHISVISAWIDARQTLRRFSNATSGV